MEHLTESEFWISQTLLLVGSDITSVPKSPQDLQAWQQMSPRTKYKRFLSKLLQIAVCNYLNRKERIILGK